MMFVSAVFLGFDIVVMGDFSDFLSPNIMDVCCVIFVSLVFLAFFCDSKTQIFVAWSSFLGFFGVAYRADGII